MIEMFEVNPLNTTTTRIINDFNGNQNNTEQILSSLSANQNDTNSVLLSDVIVNTTAVAIDYATQWLTSTIATAVTNLSSISNTNSISNNNEMIDFPIANSSSYSSFSPPIDLILNYNTSLGSYNGITNTTTNPTVTKAFTSNSATTTEANVDLIAENRQLTENDFNNNNNNYDAVGGGGAGDANDFNECHPDNPNFNCSRMDYILFILGPQTLPLYKALLITILYGGIFITGILGNVLVCIVIVKHSAMHTATNYYLFSLAVSDLIYLIFGLPTEVVIYWHQYPYLFGLPFCKVRAFISEASTYVSVLTIVAFSVERYLAICHPLHLYAMSGFKRALRIIALLWIVSFIGAIPFGVWTRINYWYYPPDKTRIAESELCGFDPPENVPLFEAATLVFFFIPMFLIFYFYGRMGAKIRARTTQQLGVQQGSMHRESRHQQSRKAVIRMLAAVVLLFFICWLPFHLQRLWYVHGKTYTYYQEVNEWLLTISGFAYYVTCTINPILYNVMSHRYRVAFKDILCGKRKNVYYNNGFARDQSSFRETTVASSLGNNSTYDRAHSVRVRSVRIVNNVKDRNSIKSNHILWKKTDFNKPPDQDMPENNSTNLSGTNAVVVCVDNGVNGRTKVFTENEAQETLLNKNNETCI